LEGRFFKLKASTALQAIALLCAGCAGLDHDETMVFSERQRLAALDDHSTLAAATQPATTRPGIATTEPSTQPAVLSLTIEQSVLMALDRNQDLIVQRYNPQLAAYGEETAHSQFDPILNGSISGTRQLPGQGQRGFKSLNGEIGVSQFFPTGTTAAANLSATDAGTHLYGDLRDATANIRAGVSVTQSLLQGAGIRVNLVAIHQAQLDVLSSQYQLRGFTETLAGSVESAYIDFALARRNLEIAESGLHLAQIQLDETDALIASGKSAASDRAAAVASLSQRKVDVINAKSNIEQARLKFLQLINAQSVSHGGAWDQQVQLIQPEMPVGETEDVDAHVRVAKVYRADLNEARLQEQRGDLQIVRTKNGLLPKLDLFITLGRTWYLYADTPTNITNITTLQQASGTYDASAGVNLSYPLLNRAARADYLSSLASREQAAASVANLEQMVELDVRSAYQEMLRAREQISATAASREAREEALQVEQERYRVGKSTSLLVSLAEQEVLNARIAQASAVASYLKGLVSLYQTEGSLLERRGVLVR